MRPKFVCICRGQRIATSRPPATRRKGLTDLRDSGVSPEIGALLTSNCGRWNCNSLKLLLVPRGEDIWIDGNAGGASYTASVGMGQVPCDTRHRPVEENARVVGAVLVRRRELAGGDGSGLPQTSGPTKCVKRPAVAMSGNVRPAQKHMLVPVRPRILMSVTGRKLILLAQEDRRNTHWRPLSKARLM